MSERSPTGTLERFFLSLGVWVVVWCAAFLVITASMRVWSLEAPVVAAVLAFATSAWAVRWSLAPSARMLLAVCALLALAVLVAVGMASLWRDISYDGQAIHFPSALEIAGGLNPFTSRPSMYVSAVYPNGLWTLQGFFIQFAPDMEAGKSPAWMLCLASVPLVVVALRILRGAWTPAVFLAALVVQANPVMVLQLTSFELDGVVYSLLVIAVAGAILLSDIAYRRVGLIALFCAILLLVNTKITGLYWAGVVAGAVLVQQAVMHRKLPVPLGLGLMGTLILAVLLVGWRPYVTVPVETGHLFGASTAVVAGPANLQHAGPGTRLAYLLWGESGNPVGEALAELKWPWQFSAPEFVTLLDIRVGGFGPGFGLQALGALLVAMAFTWRSRHALRQGQHWLGPYWFGIILLATWWFPASWWARLVSPFWLVTVLPLVWPVAKAPAVRTGPSPVVAAGWLLVLVGLALSSAATLSTLRLLHGSNQAITQVLAQVATQGTVVRIVPLNALEQDHAALLWMQRLLEAGIYPRVGEAAGCAQALFAVGSVQLCTDPGGL
ncbi:MAG: hypothetical protein CVU22_05360 [Betaproteobacteria bacterium HGW-Betaproteobacteria-16]|nr:MAG: hypothetical protein CVU22_05360 [Betaproteobacteria bacterium HGW-Betaproteobacteria-16]